MAVYKRKTKVKRDKARDHNVAPMRVKTGKGAHKEKRREADRNACRGKQDD